MGEAAQTGPTKEPHPAAQLELMRSEHLRTWGDYIVQHGFYKDKQTGYARDCWQVVRKDGAPMPSGRPIEIFGRKNQALALCQKLVGPMPTAKNSKVQIVGEWQKRKGKKPRKLICKLKCPKCGAEQLHNVYGHQDPNKVKLGFCLECYKKKQTAKNAAKAQEMGLPDFTSGTAPQIGYAISVRQQFIEKVLKEISKSPEIRERFLDEVKRHVEAKWWLDHHE